MEGLNRLIFYLILFCYTQFTDAADTLTPIESLNDGDGKTLISSGEVYEIGFFSPGSSNNRYLGIWYKSSPLTVAWVANRNNPLTDRSGSLRIRDNILVITNKNGSTFWSSNSTAADQSSVARILDSGNFVLRNASGSDSGNYFWQSFDHPTDTLLPGMKLGWDMKTGLSRILTSWKSSNDPSNGDYSCGVEVRGLPQIVIGRREAEVFRTGELYGDQFSSRHPVSENTIHKPTFVYNSEEVYYTFELVDPAIFMRLQMDENGLLNGYLWDGRLEWEILFSLQQDLCDTYNLCGPNGLCYIDLAHNCECLTGFIPKSPEDWDVYNTNGGCVRASPLDCRNGEGFIKYNNVKWPDVVSFRENLSIIDTDCESYCLKNCSCTAYAYLASNGSEQGCLFWYGDLFDVRISLSNYGQDLYVRLSAATMKSMATSQKRRRLLKVILSLSAPFILLLISIMTWCIIQKKRRKANGKGSLSTSFLLAVLMYEIIYHGRCPEPDREKADRANVFVGKTWKRTKHQITVVGAYMVYRIKYLEDVVINHSARRSPTPLTAMKSAENFLHLIWPPLFRNQQLLFRKQNRRGRFRSRLQGYFPHGTGNSSEEALTEFWARLERVEE